MENSHSIQTQRAKQSPFIVQQTPKEDNTISTGVLYNKTTIDAIWDTAPKVIDFQFFKYDAYGNVIEKHEYGLKLKYGWVIDLIIPESEGGTYTLDNLKPVHWKQFQAKGDQ